jgi:hypothetical protein
VIGVGFIQFRTIIAFPPGGTRPSPRLARPGEGRALS